MNKEVLNYIAEKTRELIVAPTCSNETKEAAQAWLNAIGTEEIYRWIRRRYYANW